LVKLVLIIDHHGLIIIVGHNLNSARNRKNTHLIEVGAELPQEQLGVSLEERNQKPIQLSDIITVSLRSASSQLLTYLQGLHEQQYVCLTLQEYFWLGAALQPLTHDLDYPSAHLIP
jgi:hypothetical protein